MFMRKLYIFVLLFFSTFVAISQGFMRPNEWKKYKRELFFTTGTSNFLGDLGGRDKAGSNYSPADLNLNQSRTAVGFGARYKLDRWINVAAKFSYLNVKGDDAVTKDIYRNNRNLNFKSNIFEVSARIEAGYQSTRRGGNKYGVRRNYGKSKNLTHNIFGFIGVGGFYYNPKGRTATGNYVKLKPLHTEGQGLPGGPKQYSNYSISLPIGAYYKLTFNKIWSIGVEFSYRKSFTDYIDDVGTSYYDKNALLAAYGPVSAQMSDPNLGKIYGATSPSADGTPAQRGNKQKDAFMSLEITASYIFKKQRKSARLRSKF